MCKEKHFTVLVQYNTRSLRPLFLTLFLTLENKPPVNHQNYEALTHLTGNSSKALTVIERQNLSFSGFMFSKRCHHINHSYWRVNSFCFQFSLDFYTRSLVRGVMSTLPVTCGDAECSPLIQFSLSSVTFRSSLTRLTAIFFMAHMLYGAFLHFSILAQKRSLPSSAIRQQRSIMGDMQLSISSLSWRNETLMTLQFWAPAHDCDLCWWQKVCDWMFYILSIIFGDMQRRLMYIMAFMITQ